MFEQTFKNIDDILHKDAGCSSQLDYVEQTSWEPEYKCIFERFGRCARDGLGQMVKVREEDIEFGKWENHYISMASKR